MAGPTPDERELTFLRTLRRGQVIKGTVTEIADFGVTFVDIGGFTAMINIPDPLVELRRQTGQTITGPVTEIVPLGVFVRVEDRSPGLDGLLPVSELGERIVEIEEVLTVKIDQVDVTRRRIELVSRER